jgi:hypothetical protein
MVTTINGADSNLIAGWGSADSWRPGPAAPALDPAGIARLAQLVREPIHIVRNGQRGHVGVAAGGEILPDDVTGSPRVNAGSAAAER